MTSPLALEVASPTAARCLSRDRFAHPPRCGHTRGDKSLLDRKGAGVRAGVSRGGGATHDAQGIFRASQLRSVGSAANVRAVDTAAGSLAPVRTAVRPRARRLAARPAMIALVCIVAAYICAMAIFHVTSRQRNALMPAIAVLAGVAVARLDAKRGRCCRTGDGAPHVPLRAATRRPLLRGGAGDRQRIERSGADLDVPEGRQTVTFRSPNRRQSATWRSASFRAPARMRDGSISPSHSRSHESGRLPMRP